MGAVPNFTNSCVTSDVPDIASIECCWCCPAIVLASSTQMDIARKGFDILCHCNRTVCTMQLHTFLLFLSSLAFTVHIHRMWRKYIAMWGKCIARISCYAWLHAQPTLLASPPTHLKQFTFHHLPFSKKDILQVLTYTAVLPLKCAVLGLSSNLIFCKQLVFLYLAISHPLKR